MAVKNKKTTKPDYYYKTDNIIIRTDNPLFELCELLTHLAKNLYNASLYDIKQYYRNTGEHKDYMTQIKDFTREKNPDYYALPTKTSSAIIKEVGEAYKAFYKLRENGHNEARVPNYLPKDGHRVLSIPSQSISKNCRTANNIVNIITAFKNDKNNKLEVKTRLKPEDIQMIKIIPYYDCYKISILRRFIKPDIKKDNGRYASIDPGLNNLLTIFNNTGTSAMIIKGGALRSINQQSAKLTARYTAIMDNQNKNHDDYKPTQSRNTRRIHQKRSRKLDWEINTITSRLTEKLVSMDVSRVIIGHNDGWLTGLNLSDTVNQALTALPFNRIIDTLDFKLTQHGIQLIRVEESYTSKASFLDKDTIGVYGAKNNPTSYSGKRTHRGLYKTATGQLMNADVNGAANIMRKQYDDNIVYKNITTKSLAPVVYHLNRKGELEQH